MHENLWLVSKDPLPLIDYHVGVMFRRKLRLLAVAFARPLIGLVGQRFPRLNLSSLVNQAERFADGTIDRSEFLEIARPMRKALPPRPACDACQMERELFELYEWGLGDVFLMMSYERIEARWAAPVGTLAAIGREDLLPPKTVEQMTAALSELARDIFGNPFRPDTFSPSWRTSTAVSLASQMYESRDFGAMPILADALQDAGCDSADILDHCRGPGPHVRGCWVVDACLGKS